ncbi:MAG: hypothetical protein K2P58_05315 [Hyphomonadaceae bacterium]|nr:hypothetical protein [Hyphomonadaceae bacterium]
MIKVRTFHPVVRLKALLAQTGGITVGEALSRARQNLDLIRDDCIAAVDSKLDQIGALWQSQSPDRFAEMYRLANQVFAEAGAMGYAELSAASHSLCTLLAGAHEAPPSGAAVHVHIEAMRALRRLDSDESARVAVLQGLRTLAAKR